MEDLEITDSNTNDGNNSFYKDAADYWSTVPATVDGMLGGFGFISQTDIVGSQNFLKRLFKMKNPPDRQYALDCGAGIGRITKFLLMPTFEKVDLVEQNSSFLDEAKSFIGSSKQIGSFYNVGLQGFRPEKGKYDIIWCQWVLGHLTDEDFVEFFRGCSLGLRENGLIIVKENVTSSGEVEKDEQDSSVTRPLTLLQRLLLEAGLMTVHSQKQAHFPKGLYDVHMIALRSK